MRCVLFNGAPGSGKDTAAALLGTIASGGTMFANLKFAGVLKDAAHQLCGLHCAQDAYEGAKKDQPSEDFFGKTPRQVYIELSEKFAKPYFGNGFFGTIMARKMKSLSCFGNARMLVAISDCGFAHEIAPVINNSHETDRFLLVELQREGCTFAGDSRSVITHNDIDPLLKNPAKLKRVIVPNDGSKEQLKTTLEQVVRSWLSEVSKN